jgi:hypothetical protein
VNAPTRRALLVGASAAVTLPAAIAPAAAATGPDAELIRLCAEHIVNRHAFNTDRSGLELEDDPLWNAYQRTSAAIDAAKPQTMDGILAKARAIAAESDKLDDRGYPMDVTATEWAWDLVRDLQRLCGEA